MSSNIREDTFDDLLAVAFERYMEDELSKLPSEEELAKMYPIPMKQMREMQRYARRLQYRNSKPMVYLKRVAVACLVIISLTIAVLAVSPTVRDAIKETVVTWHEKYVQVDFAQADDSHNDKNEITDVYQLNIGYIPDGFDLVSSSEERDGREYLYMSQTGDYLIVSIDKSESAFVGIDIEVSEYQEFKINGDDGCMSYNSEFGTGTLVFGNDIYTVLISGTVEKAELFRIARNIK